MKVALAGGIPPLRQALLRSLVATACLCAWIAATRGRAGARDLAPAPGAWLAAGLTGLLFGGEFLALYLGLGLTSASRGVLLLYTAPFFVALGAHLLLPGERLRPSRLAGLAVAFAGVGVAFAPGLAAGSGGSTIRGDALCALAAVLWAATTLLIKAAPPLRAARAATLLVWQLAGSIPLLAAAAMVAGGGPWGGVARVATWTAWAAMLFQSVVVAFASYLAWFWLIQRYPAGLVSGFTFLVPVFGIAAGGVLLGEPIGWTLALAAAAVTLGMWLMNPPARPLP